MVSVSASQLVLLLSTLKALVYVAASPLTYEVTDPITGKQIQCDKCPPGTFLRSRCSSTRKTECSQCPEGSYTQLWNYIKKCLRCDACSRNQEVKQECTSSSNCVCECKQGYFFEQDYGMCVRHSECPSGQGVLTEGTAEKNTVCHICSNSTYSDISSAHQKCMAYKDCTKAGLQMVMKGTTWHDSVCASCAEGKDAADYLKEIIPAFFVHHSMNIQRLRRIVNKLPSEDSTTQGAISRKELNLSELNAQINSWAASATASQIRKLITVLNQTRASGIAERLHKKLEHTEKNLAEQCNLMSANMVN